MLHCWLLCFVAVGDGELEMQLSDVREYIAQGADEAEACGDIETQVVFLVEAVHLNLVEGRPVEETKSLLTVSRTSEIMFKPV